MKKNIILFLFIIIGISNVYSFNSDSIKIDIKTGAAGSIFSWYITPEADVLWKPGIIGLGGGVKTYLGVPYKDAYIATYGKVELGWFYLSLGPSFMLIPPSEEGSEVIQVDAEGLDFFLSLGLSGGIIPVGPGKLGFDFSIDAIPTTSEILSTDADNFVADFFGTLVSTAFGAMFSLVKADLGICYTLRI